ncbi:uncharacterized protein LOC124921732 [Impatiens glandulifera]|uniref:uncharacterized protein LOC124921732 n=1 Tax=Impatiens glandulifera TaxID=253017 RepID=UPI001FB0B97A|nr:uncharacterized protein LOC124921732 [Impatiens glandulifera]
MHILLSEIMAYISSSKSSNRIQIVLISVGVIFTAVILNLSFPVVTQFVVSDLPFIWNSIISWFKPPYLYLVINCIILILIASSKFQQQNLSSNSNATDNLPLLLLQPPTEISPDVADNLPLLLLQSSTDDVKIVEIDASVEVTDTVIRSFPSDSTSSVVGIETGMEMTVMATGDEGAAAQMEMTAMAADSVEESTVLSLQRWNSSEKSVWDEKPPRSNRFSHRKPIKSNMDGGRSSSLKVSKPKRHETLESTWKAITEGRAMPYTRHIRKSSDKWQDEDDNDGRRQKLVANLDEETTNYSPPAARRTRKLKRESSPGQDELNRRVEAFIKKFNEEMRLQRQRSLQQYQNMMN